MCVCVCVHSYAFITVHVLNHLTYRHKLANHIVANCTYPTRAYAHIHSHTHTGSYKWHEHAHFYLNDVNPHNHLNRISGGGVGKFQFCVSRQCILWHRICLERTLEVSNRLSRLFLSIPRPFTSIEGKHLSNIGKSIESSFQFTRIDHHTIISLLNVVFLCLPGISNRVVILGPPVEIMFVFTVWITLQNQSVMTVNHLTLSYVTATFPFHISP